jgi:SAM-dependent methyltransferase
VSRPSDCRFIRYLDAKEAVDDRSLNRGVFEALSRAVAGLATPGPLRVLEAGCGAGAMLRRLLAWGLLRRAVYTAIDAQEELIKAARQRLLSFVADADAAPTHPGPLPLKYRDQEVSVELEAIDLFDFISREQGRRTWDLLVAHAFLDLVDLPGALSQMFTLLRPGGLYYFTLNFDGATIFEPPLDQALDRLIEGLYHRTMDERLVQDKPSGDCRTGRRLFRELKVAGAKVLAAGSSDWVVFPREGDGMGGGDGGYPGDEAYFLHFILDTVHRALDAHPQLDAGRLNGWIEARHAQVEAGQLIYLAHQLDFFGYI